MEQILQDVKRKAIRLTLLGSLRMHRRQVCATVRCDGMLYQLWRCPSGHECGCNYVFRVTPLPSAD
jgi:hypothetical protein